VKTEEHERAAELIAMLLRDPSARASFRRSPAEMCRDHGLEEVAAELAGRDGALQTLDVRESRSSVAGVLIAAAAEGVAFFAFVDNAHADGGSVSPDVAKIVALTRPHIAAVVPDGNGGGGADAVAQADATPSGAAAGEPVATGTPDAPPVDSGGQPPPEPPPEPAPDAVPEVAAPAAAPDLLHDPRLSLTDSAEQALGAAGPTSRTAQIMTSLLERHTISVGAVAPDGSFTIMMVDGAPVGPANIAARDLAQELTALDPALRPTAVGAPWSIDDPAFYSGNAHQHHIEVGFGEPPPKPVPVVAEAPPPAPAPDPPAAPPAADPATPADPPLADGASGSTGGFAALAGNKPRSGRGTLAVGAVSPAAPDAPAAPAPAAGAAADAAAELPPGLDTAPAGPKALAALAEARKYMGTPYLWGGSKPSTGFDCSGLMQWAYKEAGISIGRVTTQQIHDGVAVDRAHLRAGDMVFFQDSSGYVHHVGMYIGDDKFLHAPHTGDVVKISSLNEPYYVQQWAGARRVDGSAPVAAPAGLQPAAVGAAPAAAGAARAGAAAGTGGFAALAGERKGAAPRSTVQVLKAVEKPAVKPASAPAAVDPDQLAAAGAGGYPGDDAQPEQYAAWMAAAAQKAGLPPQLPIMAALTESGLHNLSGGDRDSIGFFQMRTSIWDQGEYAGYGQNPDLQLKWFITQALAIKEQRLARGETAFVSDPGQWGLWIADVERPQEDLRDRYQTHLDAANQLLGTG
jgi:cell wall-associated NlpC family hydrolase